MTLDVAAHVCFSEGIGFGDDADETEAFWASIEQSAPYAQYLSTIHGLFSFIYYLAFLPGIKACLTLTEHNNPGISKILKVSLEVSVSLKG